MEIFDLEAVYRKWLHLERDPLIIRILYALIIANRFDSDPVWSLLVGPSGSGKCLGHGTMVRTFTGAIVPVESVRAGDLLLGPDGGHRRVLTTTAGHGRLYKITPERGNPWFCNENHVLTLVEEDAWFSPSRTGDSEPFDIELQELLKWPQWRKRKCVLIRVPKGNTPFSREKLSFQIEPIADGDYFGFELDGDGRFLLEDFTVTHNSALLYSLAGSDTAIMVSTLTPNSLASGYGDGDSSLLFQLDQRMLIVEDMSSITELTADARGQLFSFLRSAYNGSFTKATGKGQINWTGKFGMMGGATLNIESSRKMETSLGERFLTLRPRVDMDDQDALLDRVSDGANDKARMKEELKQAAGAYLAKTFDTTSRKIRAESVALYKQSAVALSRLRTAASRDGFTREISYPLEVGEMGTRLYTQFLVFALAAHSMGLDWDAVDKMVMRLMLDSIPWVRLRVLRLIHSGKADIQAIQPLMFMSQAVLGRHLEEMKLLKVLNFTKTRKYEISNDAVRHALDNEGP